MFWVRLRLRAGRAKAAVMSDADRVGAKPLIPKHLLGRPEGLMDAVSLDIHERVSDGISGSPYTRHAEEQPNGSERTTKAGDK